MYSNLLLACERVGFTPRIALEVERMLTNISLVAAGAGVSAVPASMQGFHRDMVVYCRIQEAGPDLRAPLTLAYRSDALSPAVEQYMRLAKNYGASAADLPQRA